MWRKQDYRTYLTALPPVPATNLTNLGIQNITMMTLLNGDGYDEATNNKLICTVQKYNHRHRQNQIEYANGTDLYKWGDKLAKEGHK